jgi:hypothetical protein
LDVQRRRGVGDATGHSKIMRKLLVPALVALSLGAGSAALAAAPMKAHATKTAANPKAADCVKQWKSQKTHSQTRKAFLAACEKA